MDIYPIINSTQSKVSQLGQDLQNLIQNTDNSDPDKMVKIQFALQQYSVYMQYESTLIKSFKDMMSEVIQKM